MGTPGRGRERSSLDLAGIQKPPTFRGSTLLEPADLIFTEDAAFRAAYKKGSKLVLNVETSDAEVFDARDELDQLPIDNPEVAEQLHRALDSYLDLEIAGGTGSGNGGAAHGWTDEASERLRALRYLAD